MTLRPFEQVLIDGSHRELLEFGSGKHCVVIDWRHAVEDILADVKRMWPGGDLLYRQLDRQTWELQCQGHSRRVAVTEGADGEVLLRSINRALLPEYEMRIFTPTMGDGYSLLLRPSKWWEDFSSAYPSRARKLFVTIDERVAVTGTDPLTSDHTASWWRRLLGV